MRGLLALVLTVLTLGLGQVPASAQVIGRVPYLSSNPCKGVTLSLAFAKSTGANCLGGNKYASASNIPGWTYTGGASGGSYAAKADGSLQLFAQNVPRITDAGYWAEEARTNLLLRSQEFDNASWTKSSSTITANQAVAPDGTLTADAMAEIAATTQHYVLQTATKAASAITYSASIYVKQFGVARNAVIQMTDGAGNGAYAIINPGTLTTVTAATAYGASPFTSPSVTYSAAANGFVQITLVATSNTATNIGILFEPAIGTAQSYLGDTGTGFYLWQADLQAGSFATSPIPTTSVAVTRAADVGYVSGIAIPTTGTMVATANVPTTANDQFLAFASDGTLLNRIYVNAQGSTGNGQSGIFASAVGNTATVASVITGSAKTVAMAYTAGAQSTTANGANPVAGSIASVPSVTRFDVGGAGAATATRQAQGPIRRIVIYPRAFGNSELQAATIGPVSFANDNAAPDDMKAALWGWVA